VDLKMGYLIATVMWGIVALIGMTVISLVVKHFKEVRKGNRK
jgi:hypothetical protein